MAKKTVASLHDGSKEGRAYTKVIKKYKTFSKNNQNSTAIIYIAPPFKAMEGLFYVRHPKIMQTGSYYLDSLLYLCSIMYYRNNSLYGIF